MLVMKLIVEGLGLGALLVLICAVGIKNGAVGMVHLYDQKVQSRVVQLGMTTEEAIRKRSVRFRSLCRRIWFMCSFASTRSTARGASCPASGRGL